MTGPYAVSQSQCDSPLSAPPLKQPWLRLSFPTKWGGLPVYLVLWVEVCLPSDRLRA